MSEYQYYEFVTAGRQLTHEQIDQLRSISGRASISSTRFCNTYNFGDLKGSPEQMLAEYFDLFVYVSNFAYRRFLIKLPKSSIEQKYLELFFPGENCQIRTAGSNWLLEFCYSDEDGCDEDWVEGEGWMDQLQSIRSELMVGDYRSLYLAWLAELENSERYQDQPDSIVEPPLPAGLDDLTASQAALCEFLRISPHLVKAAAEYHEAEAAPDLSSLAKQWIDLQGETACKELLHMLIMEDDGEKKAGIIRYLRQHGDESGREQKRRTSAELRLREAEIRAETLALAKKKEQERREEYLRQVATQEPAWWSRVEELFEQRGSSSVYRELKEKLAGLKAVSDQQERIDDFKNRIQGLRERYSKKQQHWREVKGVTSVSQTS